MLKNCQTVLGAVACCLVVSLVSAQDYPSKPIRLIVPYAPGGGLDLLMRPVAQRLSQLLGQPVVVDNRAGATGVIGADIAAKSPPDGYTLLAAFGSHTLQPFVSKNVPYDAVNDFVPITVVAKTPNMIVVHPSIAVHNVAALVAYARQQSGGLAFVTAGRGSSQHLSAELLQQMSGAKFEHVAYKGGGPAMSDLLAGQVPMGILILGTVMPQVKAGKLRAIAVVERVRAKGVPDVPTVGEALNGYAMPDIWAGFLAPKGTPQTIVNRLYDPIQKTLQTPEVRERLEAGGYEMMANVTPERFAAMIQDSVNIYRKVATDSGLKPE
jgi:tripartite-type tricarboxylate transporter receptor subunit TctC